MNIEQTAKAAADWWAEKIQRPTFDNGSNDAAGSFGSFLAASTAANLKPDADAVDKFREVLRAKIEAALSGESGRFFKLGVDYHPDRTLAAAAEESGVKSPVFPWKTDMYFREDGIYVSEGYGQPQKKLEIA